MNLKDISDQELETRLKKAVLEENKAKTLVLHLLAEVERRRLYSKEHPSLFQYCVRVLKYCGGSAQRRIDTMRAMKLIPEIEEKIISGDLNLTSVSQAQSFFRNEAKINKAYSTEEKKQLLQKLENKSTRDCIQELIAISPQSVPQEKRRELTSEKTELKVVLNKELVAKLDRIKGLLSHRKPHMTDGELLNEMADLVLKKLDPVELPSLKKQHKSASESHLPMNRLSQSNTPQLPAPEANSQRYISKALKREVWLKDKSRCSHPNCGSRYFLEIDHIKPIALGGKTELSNLRLLCRAHNQRAAIESLGFSHMNRFINRVVINSSESP